MIRKRNGSIPVIVSIVMVPMMIPVPSLPLVPTIFVRVMVVAVSVVAIVIGPVFLVARIYVNSKSIICFGFDGRESKQTERCQAQEEISFHIVVFLKRYGHSNLRPHPLAECLPMLSDSELRELADDIKANGLRQNIMLYEGQILDGRNRYAACRIAGFPIENSITQYEGSDPIGYMISANLRRRHLEVGARAMIAAKLATATVGGDHSTNSTNGVPVAQVAKQMNVGTTSVTTARAILKADPEVAADVKAGKISLNEGAKRAGVAKKAKPAKKVFQPERTELSEPSDTKAKRTNTSGAEAKEVPVVDDATSKEEKLEDLFGIGLSRKTRTTFWPSRSLSSKSSPRWTWAIWLSQMPSSKSSVSWICRISRKSLPSRNWRRLTLTPMSVFRVCLGRRWKPRVVSRSNRTMYSRHSMWILQLPLPNPQVKNRR